jgi:hypothetical protein
MLMRWVRTMALLLALAGCDAGSTGAPDFAGLQDAASADIPILSDAVVLEPGGRADLPNSPDAAAADPGIADTVLDSDAAPGDLFAADATGFQDAVPDPGPVDRDDGPRPDEGRPPPDAPAPGDAVEGMPCGNDGLRCRPDQACVTDRDGDSYCTGLGECSGKGAIDPEELVALLIQGQGELHVKVLALPWPGKPACSPNQCTADDPCCKTCFAPLFIGAEAFPIALMGQGVAVGCQGSECDVLDLCRPFQQDAWYWVWGTASIMGGKAQFVVEGFCPAEALDLPF